MKGKSIKPKNISLNVWILGIFLIAVLPYTGFGISSSIAAEKVPITICSGTDPFFIAGSLGNKLGHYEAEGLEVDIKMFSSGGAAVDAFRSTRAQFLLGGSIPTLNLLSGGDAIFLAMTASGPSTLYALKSIKKPSDLIGKKVGFTMRTSSQVSIYEYLTKNNINPKDVMLTAMTPADGVSALDRGDIVALSSWQPYGWKQEEVSGDKVYPLASDNELHRVICYLSTTKKFAKENPEEVKKVLRAFLKTRKWILETPLDTKVKMVSEHLKLGPDLTKRMLTTLVYDPKLVEDPITNFKTLEAFMLQEKILPGPINWNEVDGRKFLREIDPSAGK